MVGVSALRRAGLVARLPVGSVDLTDDDPLASASPGPATSAASAASASAMPNLIPTVDIDTDDVTATATDAAKLNDATDAKRSGSLMLLQLEKHELVKRLHQRLVAKHQKTLSKQPLALDDITSNFPVIKADGRGGRLSLSSVFSIGLRRNMTSIASADFSALSLTDVSFQTVLRCELRTAAAIHESFRLFVSNALDSLMVNKDSWGLCAVGVRADATNSSVWRRSKLHVVEATFTHLTPTGQLESRLCVSPDCIQLGRVM